MKKRYITLSLIVVLLASMLVGCKSAEGTKPTTSSQNSSKHNSTLNMNADPGSTEESDRKNYPYLFSEGTNIDKDKLRSMTADSKAKLNEKIKEIDEHNKNGSQNNGETDNTNGEVSNKYLNYASGKPVPAKIENNNIILFTSGGSKLKYQIESIDETYRALMAFNIKETQTRLNNLRKYIDGKKLSVGDGFSQMAALEKKDITELTNPEMTYVSAKNSKSHEKIIKAKQILANMFSEPYSVSDGGEEFNKVVNLFKEACSELNIPSLTF